MSGGEERTTELAIVVTETRRGVPMEPTRHALRADRVRVGRLPENDVVLPAGDVAKRHLELRVVDGRVVVLDLGHGGGAYINGERLLRSAVVRAGDRICVGRFELRVALHGG